MGKKQRVTWKVHLHPYNLSDKHELHPRPMLRGTLTLDDLAEELERQSSGLYHADHTRAVIHSLFDLAEDALIDGYALATPLGMLTPIVTGTWSPERIEPTARQQNRASLSFTMSQRLKELFSNPLFKVLPPRTPAGPIINKVYDPSTGLVNETMTRGRNIYIEGQFLLMNGDSPERGVQIIEAETGRIAASFAPEELMVLTRSRLLLIVPDDLPDGVYQLAVTSQCCTKPTPLRNPVRRVSPLLLRVGAV